jgi:2-dehydro-3-deoxyphosphogluconate aldolase/(4S)-4-hydroxy-2-oxoglutarate aldolase
VPPADPSGTVAETLERLADAKVVAVLRARTPELAVGAVDGLRDAGLSAVEVAFTTPGAAAVLREARARHGDRLLLGAGTIRTLEDVEMATEAGTDFLVTPHLDDELLAAMLGSGRLCLPGVFTPSEVGRALAAGAVAVKLFPAATAGIGHLRALRGPFPDLRAVPTGGIRAEDVSAWLAAGALAIGAGSELCPPELMHPGRDRDLAGRARAWLETAIGPR